MPAAAAPLELDGMVPLKKKKDEESNDVFTTSRSKSARFPLLCCRG